VACFAVRHFDLAVEFWGVDDAGEAAAAGLLMALAPLVMEYAVYKV
jgi:hypothetical protein